VAELADPLPLGPRSSDRTAKLVGHPLLSYLGRDLRELQVTLQAQTEIAVDLHHPAPAGSPDAGPVTSSTTVLGRLQADLTANRDPEEAEDRPMLRTTDDSVAVHASYGPDRQVEVLREVLVGLLADEYLTQH
ncbi:exodeoxyribonuclease V subunit gamma, partial [Bradyrhizobium sp. NBAIM08]|uniref:exodeoxyribonuclease V subunit gamma n=1 Tax=Bradyrhizobium sp. NBAIM08 TaxID=2793815 RepID=UPI001CD34424